MKRLTVETLKKLRDEQKKKMEVRITSKDIVNSLSQKSDSNAQEKE